MELWIRSQTRTRLCKCTDISMGKTYNGVPAKCYYSIYDNHDILLGKYTTEERGIEILDEIQALMTYKPIVNNNQDDIRIKAFSETRFIVTNDNTIQPIGAIVYEMPKE